MCQIDCVVNLPRCLTLAGSCRAAGRGCPLARLGEPAAGASCERLRDSTARDVLPAAGDVGRCAIGNMGGAAARAALRNRERKGGMSRHSHLDTRPPQGQAGAHGRPQGALQRCTHRHLYTTLETRPAPRGITDGRKAGAAGGWDREAHGGGPATPRDPPQTGRGGAEEVAPTWGAGGGDHLTSPSE